MNIIKATKFDYWQWKWDNIQIKPIETLQLLLID